MDFSHVVVGGGVVGLAIASRLAAPTGAAVSRAVLLLDRNPAIGMETSSRNSEVIHAGLYYPPDSLKTHLCIDGKQRLYRLFDEEGIGYRRCGKWIVAQNARQAEYLHSLQEKAESLGVPTRFIGGIEAQRVEPNIKVGECALESTTTGIMDSHGLMLYLKGKFTEDGGDLSLRTSITDIERVSGGYRITTKSHGGEICSITAESVVNSAGLGAVDIANMILPKEQQLKGYYSKGQYYSYSGKSCPGRLIYPCPEKNLAGLGTHLTFDLAGQMRFGPDVEWTNNPTDYSLSEDRLDQAYNAVKQFFPSLERSKLKVDYCGIRPKMTPAGADASDFVIRHEADKQLPGFVNLLGIESPGLTSCLAIADHVEDLLR